MSNADQSQSSLTSSVAAIFSPTTLAAFRYLLVALSPVMALFGFTGLTPDRIDSYVAYAKTFGGAALAIMAFLGIVVPLAVALIGVLSATIKKQIARVRELANNPQLASAEAAKALTEATAQLAKSGDVQKSAAAVDALVKATIGLNQVQTIVGTEAVTKAANNPSVVSADEHAVVPVR